MAITIYKDFVKVSYVNRKSGYVTLETADFETLDFWIENKKILKALASVKGK